MKLQDALFNWLQMKIVAEARPQDQAAQDTLEFFQTILQEDHKLGQLTVESTDTDYEIVYDEGDQRQVKKFNREWAEQLLREIEDNPKYNEQ